MNEEIIKRTVEFMLQQQAQFAADIETLKEGKRSGDDKVAKLEERMAHIEELLTKIVAIMEKMSALQEHAINNVSTLPGIIAETDDRVNLLVNIFERFLSEKETSYDLRTELKNGKPIEIEIKDVE
jgi:hypothetical protein